MATVDVSPFRGDGPLTNTEQRLVQSYGFRFALCRACGMRFIHRPPAARGCGRAGCEEDER